jgi:hypothetical protein
MAWKTIVKSERQWVLRPNLTNYQQAIKTFSWEDARRELEGLCLAKASSE